MDTSQIIVAICIVALFALFIWRCVSTFCGRQHLPPPNKMYIGEIDHPWGTTKLGPGDLTSPEEKLGVSHTKRKED